VIYCTGYKYHYPFLEELGIVTTGAACGMHASTSRWWQTSTWRKTRKVLPQQISDYFRKLLPHCPAAPCSAQCLAGTEQSGRYALVAHKGGTPAPGQPDRRSHGRRRARGAALQARVPARGGAFTRIHRSAVEVDPEYPVRAAGAAPSGGRADHAPIRLSRCGALYECGGACQAAPGQRASAMQRHQDRHALC